MDFLVLICLRESSSPLLVLIALIDDNKNECLSKKEMNSINEIINNIKLEIENKLFILFTSSYSNNIDNIANELKELLINFAERINEILNDKNEKIEEMNLDKFKKLKREYIKNEQNNEEDPEKNENIKKLNNFLSKIAFRNKEIFPFLIADLFFLLCKSPYEQPVHSNINEY